METRPHKSPRSRILLSGAILIIVGVGGLVAYNQPLFRPYPKRLAVVHEGVLYRSAQPTARQLANIVREHGIRTVLIVREGNSDRVEEEVAAAQRHGLRVVHIPIPSRQPISDDQIRAFFECLDDPANHPVLVHCSAGRHRTGFLCALYRIEREGWSLERAKAEMLSFGFDEEGQTTVLDQLRQYQPGRLAKNGAIGAKCGNGADGHREALSSRPEAP